MAKVSKNAKAAQRGAKDGGKNHIKIIISEKNPQTGAYVYKEKIIHKDNLTEALKGF
ncbi:MAG: DUF4295 family protein [Sphingobacteriales bacterium]|jgi:hypothetical protein|nr:DUF4295 family protein [Sphingobacteriales bacterium]MCC7222517.1 DUF4295 family protein [Chitinophagales bacterium]